MDGWMDGWMNAGGTKPQLFVLVFIFQTESDERTSPSVPSGGMVWYHTHSK